MHTRTSFIVCTPRLSFAHLQQATTVRWLFPRSTACTHIAQHPGANINVRWRALNGGFPIMFRDACQQLYGIAPNSSNTAHCIKVVRWNPPFSSKTLSLFIWSWFRFFLRSRFRSTSASRFHPFYIKRFFSSIYSDAEFRPYLTLTAMFHSAHKPWTTNHTSMITSIDPDEHDQSPNS